MRPASGPRSIRETVQDARMCPLCRKYRHWNVSVLREHIESHPEYRAVIAFKRSVRTEYKSLLAKRYRLKQQLAGIMKDIDNVTVQTDRFEEGQDTKDIVLPIRSEIISAMVERGNRGYDEFYNLMDFGVKARTDIEKQLLADRLGETAQSADERLQIGIDEIIRETASERRRAGLFL